MIIVNRRSCFLNSLWDNGILTTSKWEATRRVEWIVKNDRCTQAKNMRKCDIH